MLARRRAVRVTQLFAVLHVQQRRDSRQSYVVLTICGSNDPGSSVRVHLSNYGRPSQLLRRLCLEEPIERIPRIPAWWPGRSAAASLGVHSSFGFCLMSCSPVDAPRQPFFDDQLMARLVFSITSASSQALEE